MDNNLFKPNTFTPGATPNIPNPVSTGPLSRVSQWIKSHKRLSIVLITLVLVAVILLIAGSRLKNSLFPQTNPPSLGGPNQAAQLPSSMQIKTAKTAFTLSEKIPVSAVASSNNEAVVGFDTFIEFDPEFLTLSKKNPPSLGDPGSGSGASFEYFSSQSPSLLRASAVLKPGANPKPFNNTTLFEIEFTPKKTGKTAIKIIYMPSATNDSNLLNSESKDILGNARGVEITIN